MSLLSATDTIHTIHVTYKYFLVVALIFLQVVIPHLLNGEMRP